MCVCSGKQSVNVTRSAGTDADCSYMDKDSQFSMIVYVRKNNYMEGSESATIKYAAHPQYQEEEEEETSPNRNHIITSKLQQTD